MDWTGRRMPVAVSCAVRVPFRTTAVIASSTFFQRQTAAPAMTTAIPARSTTLLFVPRRRRDPGFRHRQVPSHPVRVAHGPSDIGRDPLAHRLDFPLTPVTIDQGILIVDDLGRAVDWHRDRKERRKLKVIESEAISQAVGCFP